MKLINKLDCPYNHFCTDKYTNMCFNENYVFCPVYKDLKRSIELKKLKKKVNELERKVKK